VLERHVGILRSEPRHSVPPELRRFEHVGFVHREQAPPALPGQVERHPRHPLDLRRGVAQRIDRGAPSIDSPPRLAIVQAAGELPDDDEIDAGQAVGLERGAGRKRGVHRHGAQVGVHAEQRAQRKEPGFGPLVARLVVEPRVADGAQQHGVGVEDRGACGRREWLARGRDARRAHGMVLQREVQLEAPPHRLEHAHRFGRDLGPDPVAG